MKIFHMIVDLPNLSSNPVNFIFIYFEALLLNTYTLRIIISLWTMKPCIIKCTFLSLVIFFAIKSALSDLIKLCLFSFYLYLNVMSFSIPFLSVISYPYISYMFFVNIYFFHTLWLSGRKKSIWLIWKISSVQSLSRVWLFVTPWIAAQTNASREFDLYLPSGKQLMNFEQIGECRIDRYMFV